MESGTAILVVDDEPLLQESIRLALEDAGYQVLTANDGMEALSVMQSHPVDLVLADIGMPRMNGYQLYERVRENPEWVTIPFLFLTVRAMDSDIRYGKELGADDYLIKPIKLEDLLAAVRGKLRRAQQLAQQASYAPASSGLETRMLVVGGLRIDAGRYRVWLADREIKLSAREFVLLEYLARRARQVVPPQEMIKATHGLETDRVDAGGLLRPLIRSLRRKLGYPVGEMGCIENVRGVGYLLTPPEA
jgi:DNA-binding response OmpR family regulator